MRRKREQSGQIFKRHGSWYVRFYELMPENVVKLADFVDRVYFPRIEQRMRPSTIKGYRDIWGNHLKPRGGHVWVKEVKTYHVQQWLDDIALPGR